MKTPIGRKGSRIGPSPNSLSR